MHLLNSQIGQLIFSPHQLTAAIEIRTLSRFGSGGASGAPLALAQIIVILSRTLFTLGGLAVLVFMAWGAFGWITSGGDKAQVEQARNRITNAVIGMLVLFSIFALATFVFPSLGFDILNPVIDNNL